MTTPDKCDRCGSPRRVGLTSDGKECLACFMRVDRTYAKPDDLRARLDRAEKVLREYAQMGPRGAMARAYFEEQGR